MIVASERFDTDDKKLAALQFERVSSQAFRTKVRSRAV